MYEKGIKFKCQGSAKCCVSRGSYGYVYISKKDLKKLSKYFNMSESKFKEKHCSYTNGFLHFTEKKNEKNCKFLKEKKCSIYSARPTQCRTWPFWSENMNSKKWNMEIIKFCPGVGKGEIIDKKNIDKLILEDQLNDKELYEENINFKIKW